MAKYLYPKKKYEIERLLERATIGLQAEHPECANVRFGEVEAVEEPDSSRATWTAKISGGSEAGQRVFEEALSFMISTNELVD